MDVIAEKVKLNPHSLADWDFAPDHVYALSPLQFISPPTSLRSQGAPGAGPMLPVLSRLPQAQTLESSRLTSGLYEENHTRITGFYFRNQSPLGTVSTLNTYSIMFSMAEWALWQTVNGLSIKLASYPYITASDIWHLRRVSWTTATDPAHYGQMKVVVEQWDGATWQNLPGPWYALYNYWRCSFINRCGLLCDRATGLPMYADDTLIEAPP